MLNDLWQSVGNTPLLWLTVTLLVYQGAVWLYQRSQFNALANPVLLSIVGVLLVLWLSGTPYQTYFEGAQFIHFLLGPATVALAVPLYNYFGKLKQMVGPLVAGLIVGGLSAMLSVIALGVWGNMPDVAIRSLVPKSVTTPIAMGVSAAIGGEPSLTAVLVILTGIVGAVIGPRLLDVLRIRDHAIRGFAIGLSAHGIGTARAFQESDETGAFSGLGMGLNGVFTAFIAPLIARFFL